MIIELDNVYRQRLHGSELRHDMQTVSGLVIIGVLDESLALEVAERVKAVLAVVEYTGGRLQGLYGDGAAACGFDGHLEATRAVDFIGAIVTIVMPIAQTNFFDALSTGAAEVDVIVEVIRASGALAEVGGHEIIGIVIASGLIGSVGAILNAVAATSLDNACAIEAPEGVSIALSWGQVLLVQVASVRTPCVLEARSLNL
jgi:hypothetical protein